MEALPDFLEEGLVGAGAGVVDEDTAHGEFELRTYLEQLESTGAAGDFG